MSKILYVWSYFSDYLDFFVKESKTEKERFKRKIVPLK